jgi:hypothetical protein
MLLVVRSRRYVANGEIAVVVTLTEMVSLNVFRVFMMFCVFRFGVATLTEMHAKIIEFIIKQCSVKSEIAAALTRVAVAALRIRNHAQTLTST